MNSHQTADPTAYGPVFAELLYQDRLPELGPGSPNLHAQGQLEAITVDKAFAHAEVRDQSMADCCLAGIWLYHDFLDQSHKISHEVDTITGSYWHGLMHRREPDYPNAKYWFRRVGEHPIFAELASQARSAADEDAQPSAAFLREQSAWDPFAFIDLCEAAANGGDPSATLCRRIQQREWELLFDYCYRLAVRGGG